MRFGHLSTLMEPFGSATRKQECRALVKVATDDGCRANVDNILQMDHCVSMDCCH